MNTVTNAQRTTLLRHYAETLDFSDAAAVMAARVHLGTASWTERLRHRFGLGPSRRSLEAAELNRKLRTAISGEWPEEVSE